MHTDARAPTLTHAYTQAHIHTCALVRTRAHTHMLMFMHTDTLTLTFPLARALALTHTAELPKENPCSESLLAPRAWVRTDGRDQANVWHPVIK